MTARLVPMVLAGLLALGGTVAVGARYVPDALEVEERRSELEVLEGRVEALEQRHRRLTERAADLRTRARTAERERDRLRERIRRVTGEIRELEADAAALRE